MSKAKQRKDGRFCRKYKGIQFMGHTDAEARAKRDEYTRLVKSGLRFDSGVMTVAEYAVQWLRIHNTDIIDKTYDDKVREINELISVIGDKYIKDVVPSDIQEVYNARKGKAASYINHYKQTVYAIFRAAAADRIILGNPCDAAKPPKGKAGTHRAIEDWERSLILQSEHRFKPAVMVMLYAGLRRGEALALNVDRDVDFDAMTLTVREAVRFEANKPLLVDPKSEAGIRTIPMLNVLADVLRPIHGLVAKSRTGKLMTETAFRSAWDSFLVDLAQRLNGDQLRWYGKREGQGPDWLKKHPWKTVHLQTHDFRHSYCTMLYDNDVDFKTAQRWMGHADPEMMMKIYAHLTREKEALAERNLRAKLNENIIAGMQNGMQTQKPDAQSVVI